MATDQAPNDMNRNPTGKGGFGDNPQNRNPGGWKKEDTPRYKLEQMMKLSEQDLEVIIENEDAPKFEKKLASAMKDGNWLVLREMIDQVYGKAKESVDVTTGGEKLNVALVQFVDGQDDSSDTE